MWEDLRRILAKRVGTRQLQSAINVKLRYLGVAGEVQNLSLQ